jgi:hypothetical protein
VALTNLNADIMQNSTLNNEGAEPEDLAAAAYLLSATVNELGNQIAEPAISKVRILL